MNTEPKSYLEMSDEEATQASPPEGSFAVSGSEPEAPETPEPEEPEIPEAPDLGNEPTGPSTTGDSGENDDEGNEGNEGEGEEPDPETPERKRGPDGKFLKKEETPDDPETPKENPPSKETGSNEPEPETPKEVTAETHKAFYEALLGKPIKANGREIQLQNEEEVIRAVQMGLNYTKKMQALQPHLRLVKMLDNNKLTDERELSYLIDLHQRKPEAIQKLLADSQFDPHTADADEAAKYVPGNHQVSDLEMQFNSVLDEIETTDEGQALLQDVAGKWDRESKQAIYRDPRLLQEINRQKSLGIYDRVNAEVVRRQALGQLSGVPFLAAYEQVGKELHSQGLLVPEQQMAPTAQPAQREPIAQRTAAPKPVVANSEKAKAATAPRNQPPSKPQEFNPLEMSDDEFKEFAAKMQGRI